MTIQASGSGWRKNKTRCNWHQEEFSSARVQYSSLQQWDFCYHVINYEAHVLVAQDKENNVGTKRVPGLVAIMKIKQAPGWVCTWLSEKQSSVLRLHLCFFCLNSGLSCHLKSLTTSLVQQYHINYLRFVHHFSINYPLSSIKHIPEIYQHIFFNISKEQITMNQKQDY